MRGAHVVFESHCFYVHNPRTFGELRDVVRQRLNLGEHFGFVGRLDHESVTVSDYYKMVPVIRLIDPDTKEHLLSVAKAEDIDLTKFDFKTSDNIEFGEYPAKRKQPLIAKKRRIAAFKDISDAAINMLYGMCFNGKCDSTLSNYQRWNIVLSHLGASQDEKLLDQVIEFLEK